LSVNAGWTGDELNKIGSAEEVQVAPQRPDGALRGRVTVWAIQHGDSIYIRSAVKGRDAAWYRSVQETHRGRIWGAGIQVDVEFVDADDDLNDEVDAAYRSKYRRYAGRILNSCLTPEARSTTLRVLPRSTGR
jgi:hypothetical protein